MTQYHFTIISKNKNSIKSFFIFFNQTLISFNIINKKNNILKQTEYLLKIFDMYGNLIKNMFR